MVQDGGMSRTPYSSSQDIQMEVLDNPGLQVSKSPRAIQLLVDGAGLLFPSIYWVRDF